MDNKPNKLWKRTREQMYKSVETRSTRHERERELRKAHIKEFLHISMGMLCIFIILLVIMALF